MISRSAITKKLAKSRNIRENSVKTYIQNFNKLYKELFNVFDDKYDLKLLNDHNKIRKYLKQIENFNTRKNIMVALCIISKEYEDRINAKSVKYFCKNMKTIKKKTEKEYAKKNAKDGKKFAFLSKDDLLDKYEYYEKMKKRDLLTKKKMMIIAFYIYMPPLRAQELPGIKIRNYNLKKDNYILNNNLILNIYKTNKFYGQKKIPLNPKLIKIVDEWETINKSDFFIPNTKGEQMTPNNFSVFVKRLLGASINTLRHSYITEKYKGIDYEGMENDAYIMGHNICTQQKIYKKKI